MCMVAALPSVSEMRQGESSNDPINKKAGGLK